MTSSSHEKRLSGVRDLPAHNPEPLFQSTHPRSATQSAIIPEWATECKRLHLWECWLPAAAAVEVGRALGFAVVAAVWFHVLGWL